MTYSYLIRHVTSAENRHALPLFTSLLNTVCNYDPVGIGVPYNHLLFVDTMEPLVEVCLQLLIVTLDHDMTLNSTAPVYDETAMGDNLFINYLSRVHRDEDFQFMLKGITRLLNNPLVQSYLPNSTKRVHCHQELLVFFFVCIVVLKLKTDCCTLNSRYFSGRSVTITKSFCTLC